MDDDDEPISWQDAAQAEALLFALAGGGVEADAPAWIGRLESRLVVCVLDRAPNDELGALAHAEESVDGRWIFARRLDGDADVLPVVDAVRAWAADGGRAALAVEAGIIEERAVFGPVMDAVSGVWAAAQGPGVWTDATVHGATGGPALAVEGAYRLGGALPTARVPSRWPSFLVGFAAAAAVALALALPGLRAPAADVGAHIYVSGEKRTRGEGYRQNDVLHVTLEGRAGNHGTMFLIDSSDWLSLPSPLLVDAAFTEQASRHMVSLALDEKPGIETFVAVVGPRPLGRATLRAMVERANGARGRTARLAALRAELEGALGADFAFVEAEGVKHTR